MSILFDLLITNTFNIPSIIFINIVNNKNIYYVITYILIIDIFLIHKLIILPISLCLILKKYLKKYILVNIIYYLIMSIYLYQSINIYSLIIYLIYILIFNEHKVY